ncbi:MAG TPA: hypothetical protein QF604_12170 [Candidatus Latescibacteria bacterium]|nr:hypothetical protein [Candidatus Latescibacterota bacterium]
MRQRMEPAIERGRAPGVDIKRGTGGIVDVEFIAQILLLAHGHRRKGLRHANTRVVLERMIGERLLSPPDGRELPSGYERLRQVLKAMRLVDRSSNTRPDGPALEALARAGGFDTPTDLTSQLERLMHRLRTLYQDIIDHLHKDFPGESFT